MAEVCMQTLLRKLAVAVTVCAGGAIAGAQSAPPSADKVWHAKDENGITKQLTSSPEIKYDLDPAKIYTLAELIDIAEQQNPQTRLAWQQAKARAADLEMAKMSPVHLAPVRREGSADADKPRLSDAGDGKR